MESSSVFNIEQLIQAAEYLDRREREAEHGYASTAPMPEYLASKKKTKPKKSQGNRSTHNELEKNRRAHLRYCLEKLKDIVPVGSESSRHTTLGLLTKAKGFIRMLEDKEKKNHSAKVQLKREQQQLQKRLESLMQGQYRRQERSISECSATTNSTTSSNSETDEVDILGYGSSPSDTDESCGSDGYSVDSKRLVLNSSPYSESL
ncbi:max dimerization protein 1-like [Ostrea edulis]|uniref:max dimerization protein 1-like n=1 Tax=Ostrea edulis TaxID=37623 RepID=UPI0020944351|nr:max dimerization protein 1-like [Ostrea edulis]